jgi:hypothetical protein
MRFQAFLQHSGQLQKMFVGEQDLQAASDVRFPIDPSKRMDQLVETKSSAPTSAIGSTFCRSIPAAPALTRRAAAGAVSAFAL